MGNNKKYTKGIKFTNNTKTENTETEVDGPKEMAREFGVISKFVNTCAVPALAKVQEMYDKSRLNDLELYGRDHLIARDLKAEQRADDLTQTVKDCITALAGSGMGLAMKNAVVSRINSVAKRREQEDDINAEIHQANEAVTLEHAKLELLRVQQSREVTILHHEYNVERMKRAHAILLATSDDATGYELAEDDEDLVTEDVNSESVDADS